MVPPKRAFGLWEAAGDQSKNKYTVKTLALASAGVLKLKGGLTR